MASYSENLTHSIHYWWTYLIAGILFLIVGGLVLFNPATSYVALSLYFAWAILFSGLMSIGFSISNRDTLTGWGWYLTGGLVDLIIGIYLLTYPLVAAITLPLYIGFWLLFRSISAIGTAFDLRAMGMHGWGWLLMFAGLGLGFAVAILFNPGLGVVTVVAWTGLAMLALGVVAIVVAFRLRGSSKWIGTPKLSPA